MLSDGKAAAFRQRLRASSDRPKGGKRRLSFAEILALVNLFTLIIGGIAGYLLVERAKLTAESAKLAFDKARTQSDTIRTVADLSKILASVRPNVSLSVVTNVSHDSQHNIQLKVTNRGSHLIHIANVRTEYSKLKPGKVDEFETIVVIPKNGQRAASPDLHQGIVPGDSKKFVISSIYFADRNLRGVEANVFVDVLTDPIIVSATSNALSGVFPAEQLQAMSKHTFIHPALKPHIDVGPNHSIELKID